MRLSPSNIEAVLVAGFTLTVQVEPNGQDVWQAQVVLEFDPAHLRFVDAKLAEGSLLRRPLIDGVLSGGNRVIFAAEELVNPPNTTFTLGSVTFEVLPVKAETSVSFAADGALRTHASIEGQEVTRNLHGASITIGEFAIP